MAASKQLYEAVAKGIRFEFEVLIELDKKDRTQSALWIQKVAISPPPVDARSAVASASRCLPADNQAAPA